VGAGRSRQGALDRVSRGWTRPRKARVGVIGTADTIRSRAYDDAFAAAPHIDLTSAACPRFVDFVERGITSGRQVLGLAPSASWTTSQPR
jgi:glutamate racemase